MHDCLSSNIYQNIWSKKRKISPLLISEHVRGPSKTPNAEILRKCFFDPKESTVFEPSSI